QIRYECIALMVSKELPGIMEHWRSPPWVTGSMDVRAKAAWLVMEEFAFSCIADIVEKELQGIQELSMCPSDEVSDSGLTRFLIEDMVLKLSSPAPGSTLKLWALLQKVSRTQEHDRKCMKKPSDLVSPHSTLLLYSRLIGRGAQIILSMIFQLMYA
ncbi:hypothetical protein PAXRUDRAFT_166945, partial [Paxillus rubicundulus Ve08.2h10]